MKKILMIEAPYYTEITAMMVTGAKQAIKNAGYAHEHFKVPGAFEIPAAIKIASETGKFSGYVALGCVIRGETSHYDYVCGESARGLMQLMTDQGLAIGYGILTVENKKQALMRARLDKGNKGAEAANAAIALIKLQNKFVPSNEAPKKKKQ